VPNRVPYLSAYPQDVAAWRGRLGADDGRLKVGLAWAGSPRNPSDAIRSIDASLYRPLLAVKGPRFYSLQVGRDGDLARLDGCEITDLSPHLTDFADTAAAISVLDLVISVDTAVVHLAGALAKPVWMLLHHVGEWRWIVGRDDSPWYPTLRVFHQPRANAWRQVIRRLADELQALAAEAG